MRNRMELHTLLGRCRFHNESGRCKSTVESKGRSHASALDYCKPERDFDGLVGPADHTGGSERGHSAECRDE